MKVINILGQKMEQKKDRWTCNHCPFATRNGAEQGKGTEELFESQAMVPGQGRNRRQACNNYPEAARTGAEQGGVVQELNDSQWHGLATEKEENVFH